MGDHFLNQQIINSLRQPITIKFFGQNNSMTNYDRFTFECNIDFNEIIIFSFYSSHYLNRALIVISNNIMYRITFK